MSQVPHELWPIVCRLSTGEWPPRDDAAITAFFDFANRQSLLPLLMTDSDLPSVILAAKSRFLALTALYRKRYELSRDGTLELLRVLGSDDFLFLKGCDYRHRLYARPELRPMLDVDIYVPRTKFSAALKRLALAGHMPRCAGHSSRFAPGYYEVSVLIGNVHIDIHRSFAQSIRASIDYGAIWQRRVRFDHDGISGNRLSPADAILGHAYNALAINEFSPELIRYVDFYLLLQRHEDALPACVERAKEWEVERALFGALHVISTVFPSARTPAVDDAIDLLLSPRTRRFLVKSVIPNPSMEQSGNVTGRLVQIWRKFLLMDNVWRRFAFMVDHLWSTIIGVPFKWHARRNLPTAPPRPTPRFR